ncbi:MAG: hypothetical protein ACC628_04265 [Pirellulaceae bacterium]
MNGSLWIFVLGSAVLGFLWFVLWPRWRRMRGHAVLENARVTFHLQREWLEARFLTLATRSGRPRGLCWADCEFDDAVAFARDRSTGHFRALVSVSIQFEPVERGDMEDIGAVADRKEATVVFRLDGPKWETDGRTLFNLNPAETIAHYQHELETVE